MPDHGPILLHLLCTPIVFLSIFLAYRQAKRYRHAFLIPYCYYVVLDGLGSLADVMFRILPVQLSFSGLIPGMTPYLALFLNLFATPIQALMIYFFMVSTGKLLNLSFRKWLFPAFWTVYIAVFAFTLIGIVHFIYGKSLVVIQILFWVTAATSVSCLVGVLLFGLRTVFHEKDPEKFRFYLIYSLSYTAFFIFQSSLPFASFYGVWVTILVFGTHLPVLTFLPRFLAGSAAAAPQADKVPGDVSRLYQDKGISKREQEIIAYIVIGLSNREIEDKLFISRRTVENHVYNIYRKLGVKNRVQLMGLVEGQQIRTSLAE